MTLTNPTWLAIWFGSDIVIFFLYKMAGGDFVYYAPGMSGGVKYAAAFVETRTPPSAGILSWLWRTLSGAR